MDRSLLPKLSIPFLGEHLKTDYETLKIVLRKKGVIASIDKVNWPDYPFQPLVELSAGYSDTHLWLLYEVEGDYFRAGAQRDQESVWEDSCVEFFISTDEGQYRKGQSDHDIVYRNFEFNLLGVAFSAIGTTTHREPLSPESMSTIVRYTALNRNDLPEEGMEIAWELIVALPLDLLGLQPGSTFRANFFKCGDLTKKAHFLSWSPIVAPEPNFHLPQYFGEAELLR